MLVRIMRIDLFIVLSAQASRVMKSIHFLHRSCKEFIVLIDQEEKYSEFILVERSIDYIKDFLSNYL